MSRDVIKEHQAFLWTVVVMLFLSAACDLESLTASQKPPVVTITQPLNGAQADVGQQVTIVATGSHPQGITHIEFWVDGTLAGSQLNTSPIASTSFSAQHSWAAGVPGQHILLARAYNSKGYPSPDTTVIITVRATQPTTTNPAGANLVIPTVSAPSFGSIPGDLIIQPPLPPVDSMVTTQPPLPPAATIGAQRPLNCGLITNFDDFGTWKRGDEPFGTFTQSTEQVYAGSFSGKLAYNFPTGGNDYVVFLKTYPLGGQGSQIRAQVYGDGSGHFLNCWIRDAGGEVWQFTFGQINHTGWQQMNAYLGVPQSWPSGHVSGPANGIVDYPVDFQALVLDDAPDTYAGSGVIYIDELYCGEGSNCLHLQQPTFLRQRPPNSCHRHLRRRRGRPPLISGQIPGSCHTGNARHSIGL